MDPVKTAALLLLLLMAWAYLGVDEVQAAAVSPQVDEELARAQQPELVGVAPGLGTMNLYGRCHKSAKNSSSRERLDHILRISLLEKQLRLASMVHSFQASSHGQKRHRKPDEDQIGPASEHPCQTR